MIECSKIDHSDLSCPPQPAVNCEQPSADDYAQGLTKQQLIMEFDMATWKELIEVYDIRTACIPSRNSQTNADTWTR